MNQLSENQALIDHIKAIESERPRVIATEVDGQALNLIVVDGSVIDLRKYTEPLLDRPRRRKGTANFTDQTSFEEHAKRFAGPSTTLWATYSDGVPKLISVLNYHAEKEGLPEHCDHRGVYKFPFSEEWKAWQDAERVTFNQGDFAAFLEERAQDLVAANRAPDEIKATMQRLGKVIADPLDLVKLSRGLRVNVDNEVVNAKNNSTGEVEVVFKTAHTTKDKDGGVVHVPGAFVLHIPVFQRGEFITLAAFLRYRVTGNSITWGFDLYRASAAVEEAFHEVCESAAKSTGLPLFFGAPEV